MPSSGDFGNQYYPPPPPPLQQQYSHSQQQSMYNSGSINQRAAFEHSNHDIGHLGPEFDNRNDRFAANVTSSRTQETQHPSRNFSPFGNSSSYPSLTQLNSGDLSSSQSTTPSLTAGMSASMSMLPPGYGRGDIFGSSAPSIAHSRSHSVAGSLSGLTTSLQSQSLQHSRAQSISQSSENNRHGPGSMTATGTATNGLFSPPLTGRNESPSAGATESGNSATTAFNFFTPPLPQTLNSTTFQAPPMSVAGISGAGSSRIAPIGRPLYAKASGSEAIGASRMMSRSAGASASNSGPASGVTSPLSNGYADSWLDSASTVSHAGSTARDSGVTEKQKRNVASVWND